MRLALIQQHATRDRADNLRRGVKAFEAAARDGAELVCFAELAFEWFYPQRPAGAGALAEAQLIPGEVTETFQALAKQHGVVTVVNLFERDGDRAYDTSPVIDADGTLLGCTRMAYITEFPCFHEQGYYSPGPKEPPVYDTAVGRLGVAICFDRHFPQYTGQLGAKGAQLVIVPQAGAVDEWPEGLYEGEMRVAAFQNGYFVALCNRVGQEDCVTFAGESFVTGPNGVVRARAPKLEDQTLFCDVDLSECASSTAARLFRGM